MLTHKLIGLGLIGRQFEKLKKTGINKLVRIIWIKCKTGFSYLWILCLMIFASPLVIIIRAIKPWKVVRLGGIDIGRLGHPHIIDYYLSEKKNAKDANKYYDVFYFFTSTGSVANRPWIKIWQRVVRFFPFGQLASAVDQLNRYFPGAKAHIIPDYLATYPTNYTISCILNAKNTFLSLTSKELAFGEKELSRLGIPSGREFVCFHVRDSAYLDKISPHWDWRYHDYRDSNIKYCIPAVEALVKRGYYAVRMGAVVKENIVVDKPEIIDYAISKKRSEFMDVYLSAKCRYFISSDCGISVLPEVFRRPIVFTNWVLIGQISRWVHKGLIIFKKLYLKKENRVLTFKEIFDLKLFNVYRTEEFHKYGIELIENSPEEITEVAIEMDERLRGGWRSKREDEELQKRFWAIIGNDSPRSPDFHVGSEFLRKNIDLLE